MRGMTFNTQQVPQAVVPYNDRRIANINLKSPDARWTSAQKKKNASLYASLIMKSVNGLGGHVIFTSLSFATFTLKYADCGKSIT